jgi:hypothetical protein
MMQIASIRQIELLAMLALPPPRTLHRQTQEFELPLLQALLPETEENQRRNGRKRKKTEQNEEKFLLEPFKKILPSRIRFLNRTIKSALRVGSGANLKGSSSGGNGSDDRTGLRTGTLQGSAFRPRDSCPVRAVVPDIQAQLP